MEPKTERKTGDFEPNLSFSKGKFKHLLSKIQTHIEIFTNWCSMEVLKNILIQIFLIKKFKKAPKKHSQVQQISTQVK